MDVATVPITVCCSSVKILFVSIFLTTTFVEQDDTLLQAVRIVTVV